MFKKSIAILLSAACIFTAAAATAATASAADTQGPTVYVDSKAAATGDTTLLLDGTTYVPIRAVSDALGADSVSWESSTGTVTVTDSGLTLSVTVGQTYAEANGRYLYIPGTAMNVNGSVMIPIRVLCQAFGADVQWNGETYSVSVTTTGTPIQSGDTYYQSGDLYWLSRIINAEAGSESLEGKIAVGNVVLNRCASSEFPNTVETVVFDTTYGTQFTPVDNGTIYNTPNAESVLAAKLVLDGANTAGDSLYFIASYCAASSWAGRNCDFTLQIGNHCFYD